MKRRKRKAIGRGPTGFIPTTRQEQKAEPLTGCYYNQNREEVWVDERGGCSAFGVPFGQALRELTEMGSTTRYTDDAQDGD